MRKVFLFKRFRRIFSLLYSIIFLTSLIIFREHAVQPISIFKEIVFWTGVLIAFFGEIITFPIKDDSLEKKIELRGDRKFLYSRNPFYLGQILFRLGMVIMAVIMPWYVVILIATLFIIFFYLTVKLVKKEEKIMKIRMGRKQFCEYQEIRPKFMPKLKNFFKFLGSIYSSPD